MCVWKHTPQIVYGKQKLPGKCKIVGVVMRERHIKEEEKEEEESIPV